MRKFSKSPKNRLESFGLNLSFNVFQVCDLSRNWNKSKVRFENLKNEKSRKVAKKTLKSNGLIFSMWFKSATAEINHNELKVFKNFWTMKKYKTTKK